MPRATTNRRRVSNTVNPASMELGQLLTLPPQSLVLLASAPPLVTTGSKARLAERIHAFEHAIPPPAGSTVAVGPNNVTPPPLTVNVNENSSPANAFSEVQITQLRSLISAAVQSERVGSQHPPVPVERSLLSPVTPQPESHSSSRAIQTGLQIARPTPRPTLQHELNNMALVHRQHLAPIPHRLIWLEPPGTSAPAHNSPPLPQNRTADHQT